MYPVSDAFLQAVQENILKRRIQEENYRQRSIESILHEQMLNNNNFAFGNTIESMLARYETGISAPV